MTTLDTFMAVIVISSMLGLLLLAVSYVALNSITVIQNATMNIPSYTPKSLSTSLKATIGLLPDIAVIFVIVLIVFSWMLSAFIKTNPLAVVISIGWLIFYTIIAFFMAHYLVSTVDSISIFSSLGSGPNLLYLFWANMPLVLLFSSLIDIGIAVMSYRAT